MKFSVRILNQDGSFNSYLTTRRQAEWAIKTAVKNAVEFVKAHSDKNYDFEIEDTFGVKQPHPFHSRLPLNSQAKSNGEITYHRNPTPPEIKFGHGATHYADFAIEECCEEYKGNFYPKKVFVSPHDGLRYYR